MIQPRLDDTYAMVHEADITGDRTWLILITPEEDSNPTSVVLTTDDGLTRVYLRDQEHTEKVRMRIRVAERSLEDAV